MKCKGCGASFPSRELACPYCGRENHRGLAWLAHRKAAEEEYQRVLEAAGVSLKRIAFNRILNRALIGLGLLFVLTILLVFVYFFAAEGISSLSVALQKGKIEKQMETLYQEERFGELYALLDKADLFSEDYYAYSQIALLYQDYEDFTQCRLAFYLDDPLKAYTLEYLLSKANNLFYPLIPAYPDLTEENAQHLALWQDEADRFCRGVLGLTEDEMTLLYEDYLYSTDEAALAAAILERRAWE